LVKDCDVLVGGGGPAGIAASLAAASLGADTTLIERESEFGGNVTQAFVHTICGLYKNDRENSEHVNTGIPEDLSEYFREQGTAGDPIKIGRTHVLPLYPESVHETIRGRFKEEENLSTFRSRAIKEVETTEDRMIVTARGDGEETTFESKIVIDTTGRAAVADRAGAEVVKPEGERLQLPSYIVKLAGVRAEDTEGYGRLHLTRELAGAVRDEELPRGCDSVLLRPGRESGTGYLTLNLPRDWDGGWEPLRKESVDEWTTEAKRRISLIVDYLRQHRDGYGDCRVERHPQRIGIRESRVVAGKKRVNRSQLVQGDKGEEDVAYSSWPIELWQSYDGAELEFPEEPAGIPLGSLVSRSHPRIGMAGRCMSATHEAMGALRVIGTSMATGQAIGTAAFCAARSDRTLSDVSAYRVRKLVEEELAR
jgi:hypothetical protein